VTATSGIELIDADGDGLPDSTEAFAAILEFITANGLPLNETTVSFTSGQVRQIVDYNPGAEDVTIFSVFIPGTRRQENITLARTALESDFAIFDRSDSITFVGLTGSPFARQAQLEATTKTLQRSIPIAAVGALILLLVAMRSVRYAVVTIIPIGLVVAWLYAIMYVGGFAFNFVTATIGAISIGVGIDYSIHMTQRFWEELGRSSGRMEALHMAVSGTGAALVASALSSIVGFGILGFAPMPMFSSYGFLTAIMIALALAASLVVLPPLLILVSADPSKDGSAEPEADIAH
jgi:predicted RND superfamily exporter protein